MRLNLIATCVLGLLFSGAESYAGNFELSFNGSYFKRNNGPIAGANSFTTIQSLGGGVGYYFVQNTGIELSYKNSKSTDIFNQEVPSIVNPVTTTRSTELDDISVSLILEMGGRKSSVRPYVRGGVGYMVRKTAQSGTTRAVGGSETLPIYLGGVSTTNSMSANTGLGVKFFFLSSTALELSGTIYATELTEDTIYLHYSFSGGIKFVF